MSGKEPKDYLRFDLSDRIKGRVTDVWEVYNKDNNTLLGEVRWLGAWRQYCFFPASDCVFEKNCLRRIADFCEARTIEHRKDLQK